MLARLWAKPAITITGVDAPSVPDASNTILPTVRFRLSARIAPGQSSADAFAALQRHIREHTPAGTPASVKVVATEEAVTMVVADQGPGMTGDEAARAFDRFWQAGGDTSSAGRGAGLGLSIVSDIVAAHGGDIRLDTAAGEGATFIVSLPRAPARS